MLDHSVQGSDGNKSGDSKHVFLDDATGQRVTFSVQEEHRLYEYYGMHWDAAWQQANQPGEGGWAHYRRRREHGDWHAQALRHLFNRMLGQLHHCLQAVFPSTNPSLSPPSVLDRRAEQGEHSRD